MPHHAVHRPRLSFIPALACAALLWLPLAAQAQQAQQANPQDDPAQGQWALGAGASVEQSPYAGYGNRSRALPLLMYNGPRFRLVGTTADLKLGAAGPVGFALRAQYADEGYEGSDAPILNGMDKRNSSFWLGGVALWRNPYADLSLEWLADASGNSRGQTLKLRAEHRFNTGRLTLTPYLGVNWMNSNYVDYYFGVRQDEVTSQRAFYQGSSTANLVGGLRTDLHMTESQSLFMDLRLTRYGSGITDSPLVDRNHAAAVRVGYLYRF